MSTSPAVSPDQSPDMTNLPPALPFCLACCGLAALMAAFEAEAAPDEPLTQRLTTTIERLAQQDSYSWASEVEVAEGTRFRAGPTQGTTVRGGKTHVSMSFGPRSTEIVIDGDKAAVTNRDGRWEAVWLTNQGYSSSGFAASIARDVQTPSVEASELLSGLTSLDEDGDVLVGVLTSDAAKERLETRRGDETLRDASGTVRFSIRDRSLVKYVVRLEGKLAGDGREREVWRQTTVELSDMGTAKLDVPNGAAEVLQRPMPRPNRASPMPKLPSC